MTVCLFFSLVYVCLLFVTNESSSKSVGYQVHSWNDLSLWDNGFKYKGVTHLKIDANYMESESFCLNQTQVISNSSNGCFLLSHDSLLNIRQYNSTDNVLNYIINNIEIFNNSTKQIIFLAICFKTNNISNPCDNSSKAENGEY